jgi:hypothetical protein
MRAHKELILQFGKHENRTNTTTNLIKENAT